MKENQSSREEIKAWVLSVVRQFQAWIRPKKGQPLYLQVLMFIVKLPVLLLLLLLSPVLLVVLLLISILAL